METDLVGASRRSVGRQVRRQKLLCLLVSAKPSVSGSVASRKLQEVDSPSPSLLADVRKVGSTLFLGQPSSVQLERCCWPDLNPFSQRKRSRLEDTQRVLIREEFLDQRRKAESNRKLGGFERKRHSLACRIVSKGD